MKRAGAAHVELLVCGNLDRRDDGAAVVAARGLPGRRCGQLDVDDLLTASRGAPIVIADTAAGVAPGRVVRRTFDELLAQPRGPVPHSSHALPIDQVIGIARALADGPLDGVFVGIGGFDFGLGRGLSPDVAAGLPRFRAALREAV